MGGAVVRGGMWWRLLLTLLLLVGNSSELSAQDGLVDPAQGAALDNQRELAVEQVRFQTKGYFPYQLLLGRMFLYSDKLIFSNETWYPNVGPIIKDPTAVRVFEDTQERSVLTVKPVKSYGQKLNLLAIVAMGPGVADGAVPDSKFSPAFLQTLQTLRQGAEDGAYSLALAFCWGDREWPERLRADEQRDAAILAIQDETYLYPGPAIGNPLDCIQPLVADLDWLQRATPEKAEEATKRNRTLNMFFPPDARNWRSGVLLITDGTPFREGSLAEFTDVLQRSNLPLYTLGITYSREGNEGLSRLRELYENKNGPALAGTFNSVGNPLEMSSTLRRLSKRFTDQTYVVEYISQYSGGSFKPLPQIEARWLDNRVASPASVVNPPGYLAWVRYSLWGLTVFLILALIVYLLYMNQVWPFNPKLQVVECPTGCGRMISKDWPRCKFCEMEKSWGRLVILNGDRAGEIFYLREDTYSLGAAASDDIVLTQIANTPVKETHASLHWLRQGQKIVVQGRTGEVRLSDHPIPAGGANLSFGDVVEFGEGGVAAILLRGVSQLD